MKESIKNKKAASDNFSVNAAKSFFIYSILIITVLTIATYYKSLNNQFVTQWDDNGYVTENKDLASINSTKHINIKNIFTEFVAGNYHPLTMLTFNIEYKLFKLNPKPYHVANLFIHILNSLLVMLFIWLLCKQQWVAFATALLFAVHPMHVESVAWVSELKDVLYTFFYLMALSAYIKYIEGQNKKYMYYVLTIILFLCSSLSKAMAVSLLPVLFLIDFYWGRKISVKTILEKIPFLIIAISIGIIAVLAQQSAQALNLTSYSYLYRILFSSYGLLLYILKLFVPINLVVLYHYPIKINNHYSIIIYLSPIIVCSFLLLIYYLKSYRKQLIFGLGFFIFTIALVLQLFPVGGSLIFERYSYIPYIGLFFILASLADSIFNSNNPKLIFIKKTIIPVFIIVTIAYSYLSFKRTMVWKNNISLFTDFIEKTNGKLSEPFHTRGSSYAEIKDYSKAIADFTMSIKLNPTTPQVYFERGMANGYLANYSNAINDFTNVIKYDAKMVDAYYNRGNSYFNMQQYTNAIADFSEAINLNPSEKNFYINRALAYATIKDFNNAINDYKKAIAIKNDDADIYCKLGIAYYNMANYDEAIIAYNNSIRLNPDVGFVYYNRAITYYNKKEYKLALADALKAKEMNYSVDESLLRELKRS
jgi:tetratricopeptide (TPR) repeat protein